MNEQEFLAAVKEQATASGINPLLLISGIEGLYSFRAVPANSINFDLLDSLILTIFALRIGDGFDALARQNLEAQALQTRMAAERELEELTPADLAIINDSFLNSFVQMLGGKTPVRRYHQKALEVAALEVQKAQLQFEEQSVGMIVLALCQGKLKDNIHLAAVFAQ